MSYRIFRIDQDGVKTVLGITHIPNEEEVDEYFQNLAAKLIGFGVASAVGIERLDDDF